MHQGPGDHDPLRLAPREEINLVIGTVGESELVDQLLGALPPLLGGDAVVGGMEEQVLPSRERPVEIRPLRDDTDMAPSRDWIAGHVNAGDRRPTARWLDPRGEDADGRRLAGPVGTEEAENLAPMDLKGHAVDGVHRPLRIPLDQVFNHHRRRRRRRSGDRFCHYLHARGVILTGFGVFCHHDRRWATHGSC